MFNPRPEFDWYPLNRLDVFWANVIWPVSVSRPPPSVSYEVKSQEYDAKCHF